jgi:hypothetical protein
MKIGFHRCRRALVAALGLALAMPAAAFAQDTGRITGRVVAAQTQRPVVSAQVFVEGLRLGALADAQGRFTIPNVPAGAHNVRVEDDRLRGVDEVGHGRRGRGRDGGLLARGDGGRTRGTGRTGHGGGGALARDRQLAGRGDVA